MTPKITQSTPKIAQTLQVEPVVSSVIEAGACGTVFAYGVAGSGKSHTLLGTPMQPGRPRYLFTIRVV